MTPSGIGWQAPEFEYQTKGVSWYWLSVILATLMIGFAVWQRNFLFGVFVVIAEILVLIWGNKKPRFVYFRITGEGFEIVGEKFYPYRDIEAFSIEEDVASEWSRLVFELRGKLKPAFSVGFPTARRREIREALQTFLPEHEWRESFFDSIEKFLRF